MSVLGRGGIPRQRAWLLALLVAACAATLGPATATAAPLQFSAAVALDDDGGSAQLSSIACPSSTQCTALDGIGQETTFNPNAPGAFTIHYLDPGADLIDVACPTTGECVVIDGAAKGSQIGDELTFDPSATGTPVAHSIDTAQLAGLACPGANQCVAIDVAGNEVSFNPENLTSPAVTKVKLNTSSGDSGLDAIGCSSISACTVVDANGYYYNFNPGTQSSTPTANGQLPSGTLPPIVGMSCPATLTCVALEGTVSSAVEFDFNPTAATNATTHSIETINQPLGIACTDATHCTAIDATGGGGSDELSFDPASGATTSHSIEPAAGVACPPEVTPQCTTAGGGGLVQTFDPQSFSAPAAYDVDPGSLLASVSCAVAAQCTAVDGSGHEYTFDPDPRYVSGRTVRRITTGGLPLSLVSCPAVEQCTGISGTTEETFDPQLPGTPSSQYFSTATMTAFGCPLVSECVAVGDNSAGVEQGVTRFDPAHASTASTTPIDNSLGEPSGLSCPTASQCTTVSGVDEYTFVPVDGAGRLTAITPEPITTGTESYTAVSCPSATQCTAIANVPGTGGEAVTFDPKSPSAVASTSIDPDNAPTAISCPTTGLCVIVDGAGNALEVDPTALAGSLQLPIAGAGPLTGVYCASSTQCVAVDANGRMFYAGDGGAPPAVVRPPKPKPKPPTISGASLRIGSHGSAKLRFTVRAAARAPQLRSLAIALSGGLRFKGSVKGVRVAGKARLSHREMVVTLRRPAGRATVTVGSPPLHAAAGKRRFVIRVAVSDTTRKKTTIPLTFELREAHAAATASTFADLATFGYGNARTGAAPGGVGVGVGAASVSRLHVAWRAETGGAINGQPLVLHAVRVAGRVHGVAIVGTEAGEVLALDAQHGNVLWRARVGSRKIEPDCDSSPNAVFGVTGTPVADRAAGLVYVADDTGLVWALELSSGRVARSWPVRVSPPASADFEWGALTLSRGRLYVPVASLCDSGHYYGGITAIELAHPRRMQRWLTSSNDGVYAGGIWGWGGVSVDDRTGDVYAASGNALGGSSEAAGDAEHVVQLTAALKLEQANDPLAPPFQITDRDFGTTPVLLDAPGCPAQLVAINKDGELYLYDRDAIDSGPVQRLRVALSTADSVPLYGMPAYDPTTRTLVLTSPTTPGGVLRAGVQAFTLTSTCRLALKWQQRFDFPNAGSAPTIAGGVIYIGSGRDGKLFAYRLSDGRELWAGKLSAQPIFAAPAVDDGTVYVGDWSGRLTALRPK